MDDNRNISAEMGNSTAGQTHSSTQPEISPEEMSPAADTRLDLSKLVENIIRAKFEDLPFPQNRSTFAAFSGSSSTSDSVKDAGEASANKESSNPFGFGINMLSQDNSPPTSGSSILPLKHEENATSKDGNQLPFQNPFFITQANSKSLPEDATSVDASFDKMPVHQFASTTDALVKDFPLSTNTSENSHSLNKGTNYTPWTIENLFGRQSKISMDGSDECPSNKIDDSTPKTKEEIPNKDLSKGVEEWKIRNDNMLNDISIEYLKLYSEMPPENYDFAMNCMAYIELLNDPSWEATVSYFNETIKSIIKCIWDQLKNNFKSDVLRHSYSRKAFLDSLVHFTETFFNGHYSDIIFEFLKYCVEMCQLGVIARNQNFKEAPLRVIGFLRSSIGRLNLKKPFSDTFENTVEEYAKKHAAQKPFPLFNIDEKETKNSSDFTFDKAPGHPLKFSEAASSEFPSINPNKEPMSESDYWVFNQIKLPVTAKSSSTSDNAFNTEGLYNSQVLFDYGTVWGVKPYDTFSDDQTKDKLHVNIPPLNGQVKEPVELLVSGQSKTLQMEDKIILPSGQNILVTETNFLLNERKEDINVASGVQVDERIAEMTNERLASNEGINPNDSAFMQNQSLKDISPEYIQLYSGTQPNNQDFPMNILAYIELLNDNSWNATFSYFDENVKIMFNRIWEESKELFKAYAAIEFSTSHHQNFTDKLLQFTDLCLSVKYDLENFLYYCVQMCQIGVMARQNNLKEAPLLVIDFLRNSIRRLMLPDTFENIVKEHAEKLNAQ